MKQHYINFPIEEQTGMPSGSTFLLDAFNQVHATVWFYCFIILSMLTVLFINIYQQQLRQLNEIRADVTYARISYFTQSWNLILSPAQLQEFRLQATDFIVRAPIPQTYQLTSFETAYGKLIDKVILQTQTVLSPFLKKLVNSLPISVSFNSLVKYYNKQSYNPVTRWPNSYVNPFIVYENWLIELILLIIPFLVVTLICIPSTSLSYSTGEVHNAAASIKVTGQQWFWQNEVTFPITHEGYPLTQVNELVKPIKQLSVLTEHQQAVNPTSNPFNTISYRSLFLDFFKRQYFLYGLCQENLYANKHPHLVWLNLKFNQTTLSYNEQFNLYQRLMQHPSQLLINKGNWYYKFSGAKAIEVPHSIWREYNLTNIATPVPAMVWSRLTVDSTDVIHSLWLWDYGVKLDCIPGNPLQAYIFPKKYGISQGNCAEYCGNGHINMPLIVKAYDLAIPLSKCD